MKTQIQQLVADGRTEDALALFATVGGNDAVLLQSRYANGKRQFNMGVLEHSEWQRQQNQVAFALLDLAAKLPDGAAQSPQNQPVAPPPQAPQTAKPRVFISYNHADKEAAQRIKTYLTQRGVEVTVDSEAMAVGEKIEDFINASIKKVDAVLMVVSANSLRSAWVSKEATTGIILEKTSEKKVVPVSLDKAVFDPDFYFESIDRLNEQIAKQQDAVKKAISRGVDSRPFQEELNLFMDSKSQLGRIIEKLKGSLIADVSGENFEPNMGRVLKTLQNGAG